MRFHRHIWFSLEEEYSTHPGVEDENGDTLVLEWSVRRVCVKCFIYQNREGRLGEWVGPRPIPIARLLSK